MREDEVHDDSEVHGGHGENDVGLEEQEEHGTGTGSTRARTTGLTAASAPCVSLLAHAKLQRGGAGSMLTIYLIVQLLLYLAKQRSSAASFCCHMANRSSIFD